MAADQEPQIADDGVQDVPLTVARPLLTRLIEQAREDGLDSALTVRGRRRAYLVTPDFYEQAIADRAYLERLSKAFGKFTPEQQEAIGRELIGPLLSD
ncbi:hypothetical protein [Streptomyces sp. NPDC001880]